MENKPDTYETDPEGIPVGIKIKNLRKVCFPGSDWHLPGLVRSTLPCSVVIRFRICIGLLVCVD